MSKSNWETIKKILEEAQVIAVVGHSTDPEKASYRIPQYLGRQGYKIYPVHPKATEINGRQAYASLQDVPEPIDVVDVFRPAGELPQIFAEAIAAGAKVIWTQLGIVPEDDSLVSQAEQAGLTVVVDHCMGDEHRRLLRRREQEAGSRK